MTKSGQGEGALKKSLIATNRANSAINAVASFGVSEIAQIYKRLKKLSFLFLQVRSRWVEEVEEGDSRCS